MAKMNNYRLVLHGIARELYNIDLGIHQYSKIENARSYAVKQLEKHPTAYSVTIERQYADGKFYKAGTVSHDREGDYSWKTVKGQRHTFVLNKNGTLRERIKVISIYQ